MKRHKGGGYPQIQQLETSLPSLRDQLCRKTVILLGSLDWQHLLVLGRLVFVFRLFRRPHVLDEINREQLLDGFLHPISFLVPEGPFSYTHLHELIKPLLPSELSVTQMPQYSPVEGGVLLDPNEEERPAGIQDRHADNIHPSLTYPFSQSRAVCRDVMVPRLISLLTTDHSAKAFPLNSRSVRLACLSISVSSPK